MNLDKILPTFVAESREQLTEMETQLLAISPGEIDEEILNAIFRAAHTIKGSAGLFRLDHIVTFTHGVESVLDAVRGGVVELDTELIALLLSCCDHIGMLIDTLAKGQQEPDPAQVRDGTPLLEQLNAYLALLPPTASAASVATKLVEPAPKSITSTRIDGPMVDNDYWHISLRFGPDVLRNGMDPISVLRYLGQLGSIVGIVTVPDALPPATEMDPESCYLGFEIAFDSQAGKAAIENAFEFVRDDCAIRILPPHSRVSEFMRLIQELPEETSRLGEILVRCGTVTTRELEAALAQQQACGTHPPPLLGAILVEQGSVQPAIVEAALAKQQRVKDAKVLESRSIRIDADKLDHLINLVGELIITASSTHAIARRVRVAELQESTATLTSLVEEVRDNALQLRMVKIGATFNRFQRVVHDVSRAIGKDVELLISGEETELDRTVVERIADPLTHLVRNSIDHGIEPVEIRAARGKPSRGTVSLNAYHESGNIVIEVRDDGGGLKRDKILAKGIERGLVEPGRALSDPDIYGLIFEPGFSTAEQVTSLSGRGVGMDVVKRNILALRGSIGIDSVEGIGTTVSVRVPLTLAMINGFLVGVGDSVFVVPLDMIEECVEFSAAPDHDFTNLRGQLLPFIRLRELFGVSGERHARENIVVVKHAGQRAGLVVDTLLGEFQTVIKPLNRLFREIKCIGGSTILGTGEVALILDVPTLLQQAAPLGAQTVRSTERLAVAG